MSIEELKEQAIDCIRQIGNAHLNHKEQKIDPIFEDQAICLREIQVEIDYVANIIAASKSRYERNEQMRRANMPKPIVPQASRPCY